MGAHTRKSLSRIIRCFLLFLALRLLEELLIIPRYADSKGLIACVGGLFILLFYIRFINKPLEKIGMVFSRHKVRKALVLTAILSLVPAAIVYVPEYLRVSAAGGQTVIRIFYDSAQNAYSSAGFLRFAGWLAFGVLIIVIHAFFYEMTFRGLLITLGTKSMHFWQINLIQSGLYTFWYLIPIARVLLYRSASSSTIQVPVLFAVMLVYQMLTSVKLGLLRYSTGSVWVCIFDHIAFASILDMIHVVHTAPDMTVQTDQSYYLRIICYQVISLLMVYVYYTKKKQQIRQRAEMQRLKGSRNDQTHHETHH